MRLNFDCVRDILLCVEENTDLRHLCVFFDIEHTSNQISLMNSQTFNHIKKHLCKSMIMTPSFIIFVTAMLPDYFYHLLNQLI